jgi:aspartyl/asparaginyl-tRNA synthetase
VSIERTLIGELRYRMGARVQLFGWVDDVDGQGRAIRLRDRSGWVGVITDVTVSAETAVAVTGTVLGGDTAETEPRVLVEDLVVLGPAEAPLPLGEGADLAQRLDWRVLDLRRPANVLAAQVHTTLLRAMREHWYEHGFLEIHTPKLRPTPNRSGRELFTVEYFERKAYLAQSPQFYKQMAMAAGLERVFETGPVFRANPLLSDRHDTEFTSVDAEMSWIDSHEDVMVFEERWLRDAVAAVAEAHGPEITRLRGIEVRVPEVPFPRLPLEEARAIAESRGVAQPPGDLNPEGERALGEHVAEHHGHELVFVTEYPEQTRPFYHMRLAPDSAYTRSFDLLWKGLEITTGAQREHRHQVLCQQAEAKGVPIPNIAHYLDFFRFGCPPHGGFGLGLTRVVMRLLGHSDVREVTFLPRDRQRLKP